MSVKAKMPLILSPDTRLPIQRLLCSFAETATLQVAETAQKPVLVKGEGQRQFSQHSPFLSHPTPIISSTH